MELCLLPSGQYGPGLKESASCRKTLSAVASLLQDRLPPSEAPRFVARFPSLWLSHLVFTHFSHNTFNASTWTVVNPAEEPTSRDKSEEPFVHPAVVKIDDSISTLTFDVNEGGVVGFGLRGVWGAPVGVPSPAGDSVRDRAEVWFERNG